MIEFPIPLAFQYKPLYKPDQVICGTGQVGIVTGWTIRERLARALEKQEFAVIGQLYSPTRGINLLVRNLLANPHVRYLVILNGTQEDRNAGGCQALVDFLHRGFEQGKSDTDRPCWIIRSPIKAYIDLEVDRGSLELLRQSIDYQIVTSIAEALAATKTYNQNGNCQPWGEPKLFPIVEVTPHTFPGPHYGHCIEGKTIAETWVKIIHRIKTTGKIRPNRYNGQWQELIDLMAIVTEEPPNFYFPESNYLPCDRTFVKHYIDNLLEDKPEQEGIEYTYGQRLRSSFGQDQIGQVIQKLSQEIDSTRAVMTLWQVEDYDRQDNPCLNHIWLRVVDGALSLTATFRSNDMFSAWPANAMGLRALQQEIRDQIAHISAHDLAMGPLITISQSAHIYDDTWDNADRLIAEQYAKLCRDRTYEDPCGNFLIEVEGQQILIHQTTPGSGEEVKTYRGKNPLVLIRQICDDSPSLQPAHAGYLGLELQKAATCIQNQRPYHQDQAFFL
jgi:thymidylate synthase